MREEPRALGDYSQRQIDAAHRVLVDLGQVLASFFDCLVIIGGWAPDLLLPDAEEPHLGSIDIDLALNTGQLNDGRYAQLLKLLLDTKRYRAGDAPFQLVTEVDLGDGLQSIQVEVEFLAPTNKFKKNKPKLIENFRVLQIPVCEAAFRAPDSVRTCGQECTRSNKHCPMACNLVDGFYLDEGACHRRT